MQTPTVPTPIWGVNWSEPDRLLVLGAGGLLELTLAPTVGLRTLSSAEELRRAFDPARDTKLIWSGHHFFIDGPNGCGPGKRSVAGERLELHPDYDDELVLLDADGRIRQELGEFLVSGDRWSVADFTADFRYIVVFDPNELRVFCPEERSGHSATPDPT